MIPLAIINKPGKLDPFERMVIETHPVKGAAMCTQLPLGSDVLNVILFHHERLDGSGYPAGMSRADIPIPLRIVALVDVYDALTTDRPYAKQRTPVDALTLIREEMGRQLDMDIFKRLVHILSGAQVT
jgi:HD-GYP domain-containing protein (c-di-GMP phosphodiesterase class II)